jgi:hypothetical protein
MDWHPQATGVSSATAASLRGRLPLLAQTFLALPPDRAELLA